VTQISNLWDFTTSPGGHYSKPVPVVSENAMLALQTMFPGGVADQENFVLFSTSGVHGNYMTIEDFEEKPINERGWGVTFLVVQPRLVSLRFGNVKPESAEDFAFLKKLRESSHNAVVKIGAQK
jgi:hypothetical protein